MMKINTGIYKNKEGKMMIRYLNHENMAEDREIRGFELTLWESASKEGKKVFSSELADFYHDMSVEQYKKDNNLIFIPNYEKGKGWLFNEEYFSDGQIVEILRGISLGLDYESYADSSYSPDKMRLLRSIGEKGGNISEYIQLNEQELNQKYWFDMNPLRQKRGDK